MKPQTWEDKAKDAMGELLSDAADCRTSSIKLSALPYASELSKQLLTHAADLESLYQKIQKTISSGDGNDKVFKKLVAQVASKGAFTTRAQARLLKFWVYRKQRLNIAQLCSTINGLVPTALILEMNLV